MSGLNLYTSNRLEILAKKLAEVLSNPLDSALEEEVILVLSKGMERWVSMELARHHGICANIRFPVLTRELAYTAITRAKEKVEVWGKDEVFRSAVSRRTERISGPREALWG